MKKIILIPALLTAIGGGYLLAQTEVLNGNAEEQKATIKAAEAKQLALDLFPGTIVGFEFDNDGKTPHYEIDIESATEKVEVEVNAVTKKAVITDREKLNVVNDAQSNVTYSLTEDEAIAIAKKQFNGDVHEIELDREDNHFVYEIELRSSTEKAEFEIDAHNGNVLKFEQEAINNKSTVSQTIQNNTTNTNGSVNSNANGSSNTKPTEQTKQPNATNSPSNVAPSTSTATKPSTPAVTKPAIISLEAAKKIALSKAAGTITEAEYDKEDQEYEITIRNGKMEYEFEINALTGAIISYEEDLDDDDDND